LTPGAKSKANDPIMTRDELRACFKRQDTLDKERATVEREAVDVNAQRGDVLKQRDAINAEFDAMAARLNAERALVDTANVEAVAAFNKKAQAAQEEYRARKADSDAKVEAWNARSKGMKEREASYADANQNWRETCGNRRYREDDEKAIRAGK
jgi:erythromycin esterase-like protein